VGGVGKGNCAKINMYRKIPLSCLAEEQKKESDVKMIVELVLHVVRTQRTSAQFPEKGGKQRGEAIGVTPARTSVVGPIKHAGEKNREGGQKVKILTRWA